MPLAGEVVVETVALEALRDGVIEVRAGGGVVEIGKLDEKR